MLSPPARWAAIICPAIINWRLPQLQLYTRLKNCSQCYLLSAAPICVWHFHSAIRAIITDYFTTPHSAHKCVQIQQTNKTESTFCSTCRIPTAIKRPPRVKLLTVSVARTWARWKMRVLFLCMREIEERVGRVARGKLFKYVRRGSYLSPLFSPFPLSGRTLYYTAR